jgi:hypothetical protein
MQFAKEEVHILKVKINGVDKDWIGHIELVYHTDEEGKDTVTQKRIYVDPRTKLFYIPVSVASAGIYIRSLSFSLRDKEQFSILSNAGLYSKFADTIVFTATGVDCKSPWWVILLLYILLYIIIAVALWVAYNNWRMIIWPVYGVKSIFSNK